MTFDTGINTALVRNIRSLPHIQEAQKEKQPPRRILVNSHLKNLKAFIVVTC